MIIILILLIIAILLFFRGKKKLEKFDITDEDWEEAFKDCGGSNERRY